MPTYTSWQPYTSALKPCLIDGLDEKMMRGKKTKGEYKSEISMAAGKELSVMLGIAKSHCATKDIINRLLTSAESHPLGDPTNSRKA